MGSDVADPLGLSDDDIHTGLLRSRLGGVLVAIVLVVGGFWVVAPNLPDSAVRERVDWSWRPADEIGLVQDWAVFSPNPRDQSIDVRARLEYDDGAIEFWDVPDLDPIVGAYRQYRWNKWQERVRLDDQSRFWDPTAEWIADRNLQAGARPARVTLIRRWIDHEPLTADGRAIDSGWNEFEFHVWERDS